MPCDCPALYSLRSSSSRSHITVTVGLRVTSADKAMWPDSQDTLEAVGRLVNQPHSSSKLMATQQQHTQLAPSICLVCAGGEQVMGHAELLALSSPVLADMISMARQHQQRPSSSAAPGQNLSPAPAPEDPGSGSTTSQPPGTTADVEACGADGQVPQLLVKGDQADNWATVVQLLQPNMPREAKPLSWVRVNNQCHFSYCMLACCTFTGCKHATRQLTCIHQTRAAGAHGHRHGRQQGFHAVLWCNPTQHRATPSTTMQPHHIQYGPVQGRANPSTVLSAWTLLAASRLLLSKATSKASHAAALYCCTHRQLPSECCALLTSTA